MVILVRWFRAPWLWAEQSLTCQPHHVSCAFPSTATASTLKPLRIYLTHGSHPHPHPARIKATYERSLSDLQNTRAGGREAPREEISDMEGGAQIAKSGVTWDFQTNKHVMIKKLWGCQRCDVSQMIFGDIFLCLKIKKRGDFVWCQKMTWPKQKHKYARLCYHLL